MNIDQNDNKIGLNNLIVREKWLKKTLAKIASGKNILDAGAGELQYKKYCEHLKYVSQDFAQYDGSGDGNGLQTKTWDNSKLDIVSDITSIPVKDKSFDAIMCIEVLEHIPRPIDAIQEFSRLLKKGGKLIVTAPFNSITHFSPYFFNTGLTKYWYQEHLKNAGFKINEITLNGNYFESLAQEVRRLYYMSEKYSGIKIENDPEPEELIRNMLNLLNLLEKRQHGSEEIQCYGLHILATKI